MKLSRYTLSCLFIFVDYLAIFIAEQVALHINQYLDYTRYSISYGYTMFLIPLVFLLFMMQAGSYNFSQTNIKTIKSTFNAIFFGLLVSIVVLYFFRMESFVSRTYIVVFAISTLLLVYSFRYMIYANLKKRHLFYEPVILVGAGLTAERVLRFFKNDLGYRYDIVGIIDDHPVSRKIASQYPLLGGFSHIKDIITDSQVQNIIVTVPGINNRETVEMLMQIKPLVRNISFVPDLIGVPMMRVETDVLFDEEISLFTLKNNLLRRRNRLIKRGFDLFFASLILLLSMPVLFLISCFIIKRDGLPVIYSYTCVGRGGKTFRCYKFRSMIKNAQQVLKNYLAHNSKARVEWETYYKLKNDPRVTTIGQFLRKTSLDELPQLINVLRGDMSLVGPRQIVPDEKRKYRDKLNDRLAVLPGMTGYWQVHGRSEIDYEHRIKMDLWYIHNWSVWLDIMILFKTIEIVLKRKGAY